METKRDKFVRLAENRMNNTLHDIDLLANLANEKNYEYEQKDLDKMIKALKMAVSDLERVYSNTDGNRKTFKL